MSHFSDASDLAAGCVVMSSDVSVALYLYRIALRAQRWGHRNILFRLVLMKVMLEINQY